jgi:hypothetical protein
MRMPLTSVACHSFKLRSISVEDFTDREKSYRELLLLRSCRKRLNCGRGATRWCQCQVRRCQVPGVWAIEVKDIGRYIMGTHTSGIWLPYVALYLILYYYFFCVCNSQPYGVIKCLYLYGVRWIFTDSITYYSECRV